MTIDNGYGKPAMTSNPRVSVCIPTYNRAGMLKEAIDSVLAQTFTDLELVVSDNASDDATEALVGSYDDGRVRYSRNSQNIGLRENWKRCLRLSRGEFITILPDDDVMMPKNLERKVEALSSMPSVGLVHSKYHIIDEDGRATRYNTNWGHGRDRIADAIENRADILSAQWNLINTPTVLFRRDCLDKLGGFSDELNLAFDWEYWLRISVYYDIAFMAVPLVKWRLHSGTYTALHIGDDAVTKLLEDILVKKIITRSHLRKMDDWRDVDRRIWKGMAPRFVDVLEAMLLGDAEMSEVRSLCLQMCGKYPELLRSYGVVKVAAKCMLGRRYLGFLRQLAKAVAADSCLILAVSDFLSSPPCRNLVHYAE